MLFSLPPLQINTHNEINDFNNKFLFRWDSPKDSFGTLSSVDEPRRYLCVHGKEVTVDRKPDYHFKVVTNTMNLETRCSSVISEGNACHTRMLCYTMEPPSKVKKQSRKRKLKVWVFHVRHTFLKHFPITNMGKDTFAGRSCFLSGFMCVQLAQECVLSIQIFDGNPHIMICNLGVCNFNSLRVNYIYYIV